MIRARSSSTIVSHAKIIFKHTTIMLFSAVQKMHAASHAKSLPESSFKTYLDDTQNKLISDLKHAANMLNILLRVFISNLVKFKWIPCNQIFISVFHHMVLEQSIQVKPFNRAQGSPWIFQFHAYQPMVLPYSCHMTENKLFETNF